MPRSWSVLANSLRPSCARFPTRFLRRNHAALAQRLIEPYYYAAVSQGNQLNCYHALLGLAVADPVGALQKLDAEVAPTPNRAAYIKLRVARTLARSDLARAEAVADSIIEPQNYRCAALVAVSDALPAEQRVRKLALLTKAAAQAKDAKATDALVRIAHRFYQLGEKAKAKALVTESASPQKINPVQRTSIACSLAPIDPTSALSIARELAASNRQDANRILWNVAIGLAADNPAESERVLRLVPHEKEQNRLHPAIVWKMATTDPAQARRLVAESQREGNYPQVWMYLACGLKARDPAAAHESFGRGIRAIDRLLEAGPEYLPLHTPGGPGALMPLAEQIDPSLVPELFWRTVAAQPPIGDPRMFSETSSSDLAELLAWFDRGVAAAIFEPVRDRMDQMDFRELSTHRLELLSWAQIDPRAAVARIEQLRANGDLETRTLLAVKEMIGARLADPLEQRWQTFWERYGYGEMRSPLERDVP